MPGDIPAKRSSETVRRFEAKVRKGCRRCGLEAWRGPILVGFSGGADSTALLISLKSIFSGRGRWPSSLIAVHVHHGIRPGAADRDAAHAQSFCAAQDIPFRLVSVSLDAGGRGLEEAARNARRAAFLKTAGEEGARAVVLAHTLDDQAETVLMRLFEGAGPKGLAGIRPSAPLTAEPPLGVEPGASEGQGVTVVRPFLEISKDELLAYLGALGAEWVEDETNADESRLRNLMRRRILPVIRENLGENTLRRIAGSSDHVAVAAEAVGEAAENARKVFLTEERETIRISPLSGLALLPRGVRSAFWEGALRGALGAGSGKRRALEHHIEGIDRLALEGGPSASLSLPGDTEARREYDALILGPVQEVRSISRGEVALAVPGRTLHPGMKVEIVAGVASEASVAPVAKVAPVAGAAGPEKADMAALLDLARLPQGAVLRSRREGDCFHPEGAPGERKLKEFFIDRKVPLRERDFIPLIASGKEVIWAVGHAVSEKYRARAGRGENLILKARFIPEPAENTPDTNE
jgi:tRNA(Ile)-lysidine synthase